MMTAKEYLHKVPVLQQTIQSYAREIERLNKLDYNRATEVRKVELQKKLDKYVQTINSMEHYIHLLPDIEYIIVREVFFESNTCKPQNLKSVAYKYHYDYAYLKNMMSKIYKDMDNIIKYNSGQAPEVVTINDKKGFLIKLEKQE